MAGDLAEPAVENSPQLWAKSSSDGDLKNWDLLWK
jgi:hypothetical protein